jgi:hypothetical protein
MMVNQTYQEVLIVISEDLKRLKKRGVETLLDMDVQRYFFKMKEKHPDRYERLTFDTNGHQPYSEDLSDVLTNLRACGILETKYDIIK